MSPERNQDKPAAPVPARTEPPLEREEFTLSVKWLLWGSIALAIGLTAGFILSWVGAAS